MQSSGANFYLQNANIFAAGTSEAKPTEIDIIVQMQAAIIYKTRLSTKFATKTLERTTRIIRKEHRRLKDLISKRRLQIPVSEPDQSQMNTVFNLFDESSFSEHAQEAESFLQAIFDIKMWRDEHARTILSTYEEVNTAQLTKPEATITTQSGRVSPPSLKRKAAEDEVSESANKRRKTKSAPTSYRITWDCSHSEELCYYFNRSKEEHSGFHVLKLQADATSAKQRVPAAQFTPNQFTAQRAFVRNQAFLDFPEQNQRTWVSLRKNAARYSCTITPNAEVTETKLQKFQAEKDLDDTPDKLPTQPGSERPLLAPSLLAIRRKFVSKEIDITAGATPSSNKSWNNSPIAAIWAGPVHKDSEKDSIYSLSAFSAALQLRKEKGEIVAAIRCLNEARNAYPPITTKKKQLLSPPQTPNAQLPIVKKGKFIFSKKVVELAKKEGFEDVPLSAVPYSMRLYMARDDKKG